MEAQASDTAVGEHTPILLNQPHESEHSFHGTFSQSWPAINGERSATPLSQFSDQHARNVLEDGSIGLPTRSVVPEHSLYEIDKYGDTSVDPSVDRSNFRHIHDMHASATEQQKYSPDAADKADLHIAGFRATDDIFRYLKDDSASPDPEAAAAAAEPEEAEDHDTAAINRKQSKRGQKRKSNESRAHVDNLDERPVRILRERTVRQVIPFKMDIAEHKHVRSGKKKTESDLEDEVVRTQIRGRKQQARKAVNKDSKRTKTRRLLARQDNLPLPTPTASAVTADNESDADADVEPDVWQTIVRTRLKEFGKGYLPIMLPRARSIAALFQAVQQKWHRGLNGRELHHCIVSFPWLGHLGEDEDMIMFVENDDEVYGSLLEKIKDSPAWINSGRCEIDLMIYPEAKQ